MNVPIRATREQRRQLARDNAKLPKELIVIAREEWPQDLQNSYVGAVLRSRDYLVQVYYESPPVAVRLSVCRTSMDGDRWRDGLSWDELQDIKRQCGYGGADAVEIYPRTVDVVNVANMRHLWVLREPLVYAWRSMPSSEHRGGE